MISNTSGAPCFAIYSGRRRADAPVALFNATRGNCEEADWPEPCTDLLIETCTQGNFTLALCSERGINECALDNGNCGDPRYVTCGVELVVTYTPVEGNYTYIRVNRNSSLVGLDADNATADVYVASLLNDSHVAQLQEQIALFGGEVYEDYGVVDLPSYENIVLCDDVDECLVDNGGCGIVPYVKCLNYYARPHGCRDVNECEFDNGACGDPLYTECINFDNVYSS
eukprot:SAG31_NODE_666_length_12962_cov_37.025033_2_plen_227_part_00